MERPGQLYLEKDDGSHVLLSGEIQEFDAEMEIPESVPKLSSSQKTEDFSSSGTMTFVIDKEQKQKFHDWISTLPVDRHERNNKIRQNRQQMMNRFQHKRKEWWIGR